MFVTLLIHDAAMWLLPAIVLYLSSTQSVVLRLRSHKHEYESGTVSVPLYEFWQTQSLRVFHWRPFTYIRVLVSDVMEYCFDS